MAITSLLFGAGKTKAILGAKKRTGWSITGSKYSVIDSGVMIDAVVNETHNLNADVTQYEVESGAVISDHVQIKPVQLTIEGIISETPISFVSTALTAGATALGTELGKRYGNIAAGVGTFAGASLSGLITSKPTAQDVFKVLKNLFEKKEPFTVVTGLTVYDNMIITSLSIPRNAATGKALRFTATLQQIKIVETQTVPIPEYKTKTALTSSSQDLGKQATTAATAAEKGKSFLLKAINFFRR
jgi:hypothetical protein